MINGQIAQWLDELRLHGQHMLAVASVVKVALPIHEWVRTVIIALVTAGVTALVTSQITMARFDERLIAMKNERELILKRRDEQVLEIKKDIDRIESILQDIRIELARSKK